MATAPHRGPLPAEYSFVNVEPENLVLEVIKKAYDSDQTILRFVEMHGQDVTAKITFPIPIQSAQETDLLEREKQHIPVSGSVLEFPIHAHEIKTIQITLSKPTFSDNGP